jgi:alpha-tubulin suppressor-like RCC1 family protein
VSADLPAGIPVAWGFNAFRQLGDGSYLNQNRPVQVNGLGGVIALDGGYWHSLALRRDGTVWAWGDNTWGQLGDGTATDRGAPIRVPGLSDVTAIAAGLYFSMALRGDGTVWAWGNNEHGQLGDGTTAERWSPVQVAGLSGAIAIAAGDYHALGATASGSVWAWGANVFGQVGDGTTIQRPAPVKVSDGPVTAVAAGSYHSLAAAGDGTAWGWGDNTWGQLGTGAPGGGTCSCAVRPARVTALGSVTTLAGGWYHSLARRADGTVWAWGANGNGQLGNGRADFQPHPTPAQVRDLTGVTDVDGGSSHSLALRSDGSVWTWGNNIQGQLGNGSNVDRRRPVRVALPSGLMVVAVGSGADHVLAAITR